MRSPTATTLAAFVASILAVGCGSSTQHARSRATTPSRAATTRAPSTTTITTVAPVRTSAPATTATIPATTTTTTPPAPPIPPTTVPPVTAPPTTAPAPAGSPVSRLSGIGAAQQVIVVAAGGYGTSTATVTAYERDATGWTQAFGPWAAYIGRNGVAPAGAKREGDGRTPSGVYGFDFMFGVDSDPGVRFPFRHIAGPNIVWDDDPASPDYNEWIDTNSASAGANPEPMDNTPSYLYGAVIAYNDARTPGLGSAIFLHVSHGSSTAGCVSLPVDELLEVLRWLDPARSPRIAIGTVASLGV